jgi:hypothetical protein
MISIAPIALALAASLAIERAPQERRPSTESPAPAAPATLAQVKALFARLDLDQDSTLDLAESARQGLAPRDVSARDADGDGKLNADEFVLAYRAQQVARGAKVAADVDAEATRIERARAEAKPARPVAPRQPAGDPKADLERAIDEALRRAAVEPRADRPRREPASAPAETSRPAPAPAPANPAAPANRPESEPAATAADASRAKSEPAPRAAIASTAPADSLDERARAVEEALVQRLRESGASEAEIAAARDRLRKRLTAARDRAGAGGTDAADAAPAPGTGQTVPAAQPPRPADRPGPTPAPATVPGAKKPGATPPQPEKGPVPSRPVEPERPGANPAPGPRPPKPPKDGEAKPARPSGG